MDYILSKPITQSIELLVTGPDRFQYFKNPIVAKFVPEPPERLAQVQQVEEAKQLQQSKVTRKDMEIMTDYRENETQTDPYTPDEHVQPGTEPEILMLKDWHVGTLLPATVAEMEIIEQMREKKAFEDALPPTTDEVSFVLRRRLMEEQEFKDWAERESKIKSIQNEKLNLLESALLEREKGIEEKHAQRTEEIRSKRTEQKDRKVAKIYRLRIKVLRKKVKSRKNMDQQYKKRDIISEYENFGSIVYAPITREGLSLDKKANKYEVHPEALTTYQKLSELSKELPDKVLNVAIDIKEVEFKYQKETKKQFQKHLHALDVVSEAIDQQNAPKDEDQAKEKYKDTPVRAVTPNFDKEDEEEEKNAKQAVPNKFSDRQTAIIFLQRLFRGRYRQNIMFDGKEKRLALIRELKSTAEWKATAADEEEKDIIAQYQEKLLHGAVDAVQGEQISGAFDKLSKELVRFKQERNIAAMVKLAERQRRMKEAEESGRRQAEEILREREDVVFREIMGVHQGTVDSYLKNIIEGTVSKISTDKALKEADVRTNTLNPMLGEIEDKHNKKGVMIREIVSSFLIPEVLRNKDKKQFNEMQMRFLQSTRGLVEDVQKGVKKKLGEKDKK